MPDKPRTWPYALLADTTGKSANVRKLDGVLVFDRPEPLPLASHIHACLNEAFDWGVQNDR